jgi:hypothetical protein
MTDASTPKRPGPSRSRRTCERSPDGADGLLRLRASLSQAWATTRYRTLDFLGSRLPCRSIAPSLEAFFQGICCEDQGASCCSQRIRNCLRMLLEISDALTEVIEVWRFLPRFVLLYVDSIVSRRLSRLGLDQFGISHDQSGRWCRHCDALPALFRVVVFLPVQQTRRPIRMAQICWTEIAGL